MSYRVTVLWLGFLLGGSMDDYATRVWLLPPSREIRAHVPSSATKPSREIGSRRAEGKKSYGVLMN
jgi:hypothetical protein